MSPQGVMKHVPLDLPLTSWRQNQNRHPQRFHYLRVAAGSNLNSRGTGDSPYCAMLDNHTCLPLTPACRPPDTLQQTRLPPGSNHRGLAGLWRLNLTRLASRCYETRPVRSAFDLMAAKPEWAPTALSLSSGRRWRQPEFTGHGRFTILRYA
jgi:hypothetical protein